MTENEAAQEALSDLVDHLDEIGRMQCSLPGYLTGLHLSSRHIELINGLLTHDDPVGSSVGRYLRVPVYPLGDLVLKPEEQKGEHAGITFTYYEVDFLG